MARAPAAAPHTPPIIHAPTLLDTHVPQGGPFQRQEEEEEQRQQDGAGTPPAPHPPQLQSTTPRGEGIGEREEEGERRRRLAASLGGDRRRKMVYVPNRKKFFSIEVPNTETATSGPVRR
jgi:hypothetical protein